MVQVRGAHQVHCTGARNAYAGRYCDTLWIRRCFSSGRTCGYLSCTLSRVIHCGFPAWTGGRHDKIMLSEAYRGTAGRRLFESPTDCKKGVHINQILDRNLIRVIYAHEGSRNLPREYSSVRIAVDNLYTQPLTKVQCIRPPKLVPYRTP
jgi:hypothetical protein